MPVYKPPTESEIAAAVALVSGSGGAEVGTVGVPTSGTVATVMQRFGPFFSVTFTLTLARVPVTDGAASGSYGTLKLLQFNQACVSFLGSRQDYMASAEGTTLTTAAGDAAYVWGVGSAAVATARDGTLTTTEQDIGTKTSTITNTAGTGAGTQVNGAVVAGVDGTSTAKSINLNWSGSAATIDGSDYIDVTGTITVVGVFLGDD